MIQNKKPNFHKNKHQKQKFNPNFKKKTPTWKQIDEEINGLVEKYEGVSSLIEKFTLSDRNSFNLII